MTILALLTYLPIPSLHSIKMVSIIFDYIIAITILKITMQILKENKHKNKIGLLLYSLVLFLPTVFINSACWAQADAIYTAFILISILNLLKGKYTKSFIFLGIAFSFKLQAIFILPLYILIYISERKFSIFNFLLIIITSIVMCIPSIIFGNSLSNCINVYINQTGTYSEYITLNFPNIYSIFFYSAGSGNLVKTPNDLLANMGIIITMFIFVVIAYLVLEKKVKFSSKAIIEFGLWSVLICTFFLPRMHERYLYLGDILALVYLIYNRKRYYIALGIELVSLNGYLYLLFGGLGMNLTVMSIVNLVIVAIYSKDMYSKYFAEKEIEEITE